MFNLQAMVLISSLLGLTRKTKTNGRIILWWIKNQVNLGIYWNLKNKFTYYQTLFLQPFGNWDEQTKHKLAVSNYNCWKPSQFIFFDTSLNFTFLIFLALSCTHFIIYTKSKKVEKIENLIKQINKFWFIVNIVHRIKWAWEIVVKIPIFFSHVLFISVQVYKKHFSGLKKLNFHHFLLIALEN